MTNAHKAMIGGVAVLLLVLVGIGVVLTKPKTVKSKVDPSAAATLSQITVGSTAAPKKGTKTVPVQTQIKNAQDKLAGSNYDFTFKSTASSGPGNQSGSGTADNGKQLMKASVLDSGQTLKYVDDFRTGDEYTDDGTGWSLTPGGATNGFNPSKIGDSGLNASAVGTETIDGVMTTHFTHVVAGNQSPGSLEGQIAEDGEVTITADMWIDADSNLRKVSLDATVTGGSTPGHSTVVINYTNFRAATDVALPQ